MPPLPSLPAAPDWPPRDAAIAGAAAAAMADGSWGRYEGRHGELLREALTGRFQRQHVRLCSSGTIAVELALRAMRVEGGEVLLAGYDFPGNFRAVEQAGAEVALAELPPGRYTLSLEQVEEAAGERTRAVVVSHLHGQLAPMAELRQWADRRGVLLLEDVCQAPGAQIDGRPAGAWGHAATLSFGGSKLLTAGRGGAVLTDDATLAQRMTVFCERGNDAFPLSELQAAVLLPQLQQLDDRNAQRRRGAERLASLLQQCGGPQLLADDTGAVFRAAWRWPQGRDEQVQLARQAGAPVGAGFRGFYRRSRCRRPAEMLQCRRAAEQTALLHHAALLGDDPYLEQLAQCLAACQTFDR